MHTQLVNHQSQQRSSQDQKKIIDQQEAVVAVAEAVRRGRIGLASANRPIASFIFLGPSGVGKSRWARTHAAETNQRFYLKENEDLKWWDGYTDEEIVLIEEWDPNMTKYVKWLKQLVDHYAVTVQTKGGMIKIRPKEVIITSNYSLEDCFRGLPPVELEALNRRFERITF